MLNSGLASNVVKTALDKVFKTEFDYTGLPGLAAATSELVFKQDTADKSAVIVEQYMGPGYFEERAEQQNVAEGTIRVGNQQTHSVLNFAKGVDISKNFFDDDQHSVVKKMMTDLGRVARITRDKFAMNKFNLGFTTVLANDAVALFSNSHTTLNGDTVDNLETAALTESSLDTAIQSLLNQVTQDGTLGGHEPACLLVPTALFKTAQIIAKSELRSGTANNDLNYYSQIYPGLQVRFSPFLGTTFGGSNTAWYLLSRNHSMMRWVRQEMVTRLLPWEQQRNNNYVYKAEYREVVAPISYEGLVGSTGLA